MKPPATIGEIGLQLRGFIEEHVCPPHHWYVGLASDAESTLFQKHKVNRQRDSWIYRETESPGLARSIQESFLKLGCDGERYPDEFQATAIYIYLKSGNTTP